MHHCYSDARAKQKRCSFGVIVVNQATGLMSKKSGVFSVSIVDSLTAEIAALNIAASMVPPDLPCVIHHDLYGLSGLVDNYTGDGTLLPHIEELRRQIATRQARILYEDRDERSDWYRQCHKMAHQEWNSAFRSIARQTPKQKKPKKPKTRWIIRRV